MHDESAVGTATTSDGDRDTGDGGRLLPSMVEIIERAEVGVVATADAHGECDSSLRTGPPGFVRILDERRVAYPEYRGNGVLASLGNIHDNPHVGLLLVDFAGDRTRLHLSGTAAITTDEDLRAEHPDLPTETVPGRRTDVWVVISLEEATLDSGKDVPALTPVERPRAWGTDDATRKGGDFFGAAAAGAVSPATRAASPVPDPTPAGATPAGATSRGAVPAGAGAGTGSAGDTGAGPPAPTPVRRADTPAASRVDAAPETTPLPRTAVRAPRPTSTWSRTRNDRRRPGRWPAVIDALESPVLTVVLGVLVVVLAVGLLASLLSGPGETGAAPPVAATSGPVGPPTLYGRVVDVPDPGTVVVDVQGDRVVVGVLGIDAATIPPCATAAASAFAHRTLDRQLVTLVPDPTVAPTGPTRQAYVVLPTQLSYTDALIRAGWAEPAGTALYRPSFDAERREAESASRGIYGPPCVPS